MAITLVASVGASPGTNGGASAAITTTGATLLVLTVASYSGAALPAVSDSKGNTWIPLTVRSGAGNFATQRFHYCLTPTVGTGHTFTATTTGGAPTFAAYAFAGVASYQTESGAGLTGSVASLATGSVTPSTAGALVLTGSCSGLAAVTESLTPAGFTVTTQPFVTGTAMQGSGGYLIQAVAAALNPTWAFSPAQSHVAVGTAVFLAGVTLVAVPDVVGLTVAAATTALAAVGLGPGAITYTVSAPAGEVLSQAPIAGTLVDPGSAVDLVVAVAPGLVVTVDGIAQRVLHDSLSIQATVNGRDRLSATLPLPTVAPDVRQEILATFDGVRIFAGFLDTVTLRAGSSWTDRDDQLLYDITAADYNVLCDWRLVNGPRPEETIKAYLTDLVLFLAGVTLHPAQVDGPLLPSRGQTFQTISHVLDEVTTITGYVWNIDYDGRLRMWLPSVEPAPFDILDSNAYAIGDITVEPSTTGYANMVWVVAGDSGQHDISSTFVGDGTTLEWDLPHGLVTHGGTLTHAGVPENVGPGEAWELDALPTPFAFTLRRAIGSAPAVGALIVFPYTAQYPLVFRAQDYDVIAEVGFIVEQVFQEPTVFDPAQGQALVDGYLAQLIQAVREVRYTTLRGDILPGQTQTITIATRALSGSFVISDVETRMQDPLLVRHVTARNPGPYAGSWRDVYKLWAQGQTSPVASVPPALVLRR